MSRRALTVWVDCEDKDCGFCPYLDDWWCLIFGEALNGSHRCPACLAAESKALKQTGHLDPEREVRAQMPTVGGES